MSEQDKDKTIDNNTKTEVSLKKVKATYNGSHQIGEIIYKFEKDEQIEVPSEYFSGFKTMFQEATQAMRSK